MAQKQDWVVQACMRNWHKRLGSKESGCRICYKYSTALAPCSLPYCILDCGDVFQYGGFCVYGAAVPVHTRRLTRRTHNSLDQD